MARSRVTRALALLGLLPLGVLLVALIYMLGMARLESETRDFWQSLAWAAETMTTTGYGHDNRWGHPLMIVFVVAVQFVGVFLVFLVIPIFAIPYLESRFESRLPRMLPAKLENFVLIYRHGPAVASLIRDLERERIPTVVLEEDEALARRLRDCGTAVVYTRIADENPLGQGLEWARALILNGEDHDNAVLVLSARQNGFEGPIYAFVENPIHRKPIELAGATAAYSPKHALAAALAAQASHRISPRVAGLHQLGEHLEVAELRIHRDSPVVNATLAEARIRERTGATVVGQWIGGSFTTEMGPQTVLRHRAILVAVGSHESIQRLGRLAAFLDRTGPLLVAGYGQVGQKVVQMLRDAGEHTISIDREERDGVDLVADALEVDALRRARVETARAVILALASDSTNLFAAAIVRDLAPEVPIIARVNQAKSRAMSIGVPSTLPIELAHFGTLSVEYAPCGGAGEPMLRIVTSVFIAMATVCISNLARAQDDFSRTGCYLGLAGTVAFPNSLEKALENETDLNADVSESLGLHARGGCRSKWIGGEVHYEWLDGADVEVDGFDVTIEGWALTLDGKLYPLAVVEHKLPPLARRFQPFATMGFGYVTFDGLDPLEDWDFAARLGGGLDVYVTRNIVINVDATYLIPVSDTLKDLDYLSVGWGVLFRF